MPLGWAKAVTGQTVHPSLRSIFPPVPSSLLHIVFEADSELKQDQAKEFNNKAILKEEQRRFAEWYASQMFMQMKS